jgi:UDP-N-acetylmuramate dehydrogenase
MQIQENIALQPYNTFGIAANARHFASFTNTEELMTILERAPLPANRASKLPLLVLGGGSNILFTGDFDGLVLKNNMVGIEELHEDEEHVYVRAGAGENWHRFVLRCISNQWAGVENLSLIPGNVGASPMQNIGAYGVEVKDVFHSLEAYHIEERKIRTFTLNDCEFGYRESVFKKAQKDQYVILSVTFRLRKKPIFHTSYGAIREELERMNVSTLSIAAISQAVINIRSAKLPDPNEIGNAGSFFKNPEIEKEQAEKLQKEFPGLISYPLPGGGVKLAAGWLIEQCGWKGYRKGDAGCHVRQALVLVNYGEASGKEIYDLSQEILQSVRKKFGVTLEREVNIV